MDGAYPTTPKGETYGPRMARYLVGYEPDLIAVVGDEGMRGYVRRSEYQWASYGGGVLEVYDLKGAVIDQFTVKAGRRYCSLPLTFFQERICHLLRFWHRQYHFPRKT